MSGGKGRVVLAGAGPGDPELITIKALTAISNADCIVYDRLVARQLLDAAKPGCELVFAGKENRHHALEQNQINELLAEKAAQHKLVVRLKGGDPFVFGRGMEELAFLRASGIECEVVPGVSSAIAAPASAGIALTLRGVAESFHVFTAHDRRDVMPELDFSSMLDDAATYVFLMGLGTLPELMKGLSAAGKSPACPVAVISAATTRNERKVVGNIADIASKAAAAKLSPPAIIVVGKVVEVAEKVASL